jgi:hypothetical protein
MEYNCQENIFVRFMDLSSINYGLRHVQNKLQSAQAVSTS